MGKQDQNHHHSAQKQQVDSAYPDPGKRSGNTWGISEVWKRISSDRKRKQIRRAPHSPVSFQKILEKSRIEEANYHALRHTFATRCIELGFDIKSLSEILGHASVNITLNRYVHPSMELKRDNMEKLSELIAG